MSEEEFSRRLNTTKKINKKGLIWLAVIALAIVLSGAYYQYQAQTANDSSIAINSSIATVSTNSTDTPGLDKVPNETNNTKANQSASTVPLEKPPFIE